VENDTPDETYGLQALSQIEKERSKNKIVDWKITDSATKDKLMVELTELRFETIVKRV
jgi:hypothetical protein